MAKRKGKMPAGLAAYWAKKRGKKKARKRASPKRRRRVARTHGPTRRTLRRDVRAAGNREIATAKQLIAEEMRKMREKLRGLNMGFSGRAGRRK